MSSSPPHAQGCSWHYIESLRTYTTLTAVGHIINSELNVQNIDNFRKFKESWLTIMSLPGADTYIFVYAPGILPGAIWWILVMVSWHRNLWPHIEKTVHRKILLIIFQAWFLSLTMRFFKGNIFSAWWKKEIYLSTSANLFSLGHMDIKECTYDRVNSINPPVPRMGRRLNKRLFMFNLYLMV